MHARNASEFTTEVSYPALDGRAQKRGDEGLVKKSGLTATAKRGGENIRVVYGPDVWFYTMNVWSRMSWSSCRRLRVLMRNVDRKEGKARPGLLKQYCSDCLGRAYEDDEIKEMPSFALALRVFNANDSKVACSGGFGFVYWIWKRSD